MRADLAVVPVQPSGIDVQSAADAVRLIKQAMEVRLGPPQAVMFRLPCGEGNEAQNRSNGAARETYTHHQSDRIGHSPKTSDCRFFGSGRYGVGFGRSTCLIFRERVQSPV